MWNYFVLSAFCFICFHIVGSEKRILLNDPDVMNNRINHLENLVTLFNTSLAQVLLENRQLKQDQIKQQQDLMNQKQTIQHIETVQSSEHYGALYTRWGRTQCSGEGVSTEMIYSGYAAGKHYGEGGSGANILCLPKVSEWSRYDDGINSLTGRIFGVELDVSSDKQAFGTKVLNIDIHAMRSMIPGKMTCFYGWHKEFSGYLVAQESAGRTATEYICADENPEPLPGGNEGVLYPVEIGGCQTLNCPPYVKGRELTCVVCSK